MSRKRISETTIESNSQVAMGPRSKHGLLALLLRGVVSLSVLCVFSWAAPARFAASASSTTANSVRAHHLTVNLVPLTGSIAPGGTTEVGLHFILDQDWHVYWVNAGDAGEPPSVKWKLPSGLTAGPMQFPTPERLPVGPLMDYGYQNEVLFPIHLEAAKGLRAPSSHELHADVEWLVCREVCIPGKASLKVPMHVTHATGNPDAAVQALFARFDGRMPQALPPGTAAKFAVTPSGFTLALLNLPPGTIHSRDLGAAFFPLEKGQIDNPARQRVLSSGRTVELLLTKDANLSSVPAKLSGVIQLANGPSYKVDAVQGTVPGIAGLAESSGASSGSIPLLRAIFFAFLGGMVLNLMPCVFPVLFLKGLALVQSSGETRKRLRAHGFSYALGILISFWLVAGMLIGLRAAGSYLGWGFQFQSPEFLAVIAMVLFLLGLSLAGMFEVGLTLTSAGSGLANRSGYAGSFFTGVLAMVVATPCTAPFMGAALGFALAAPAVIALAIFTALALGLAAPYVLLTMQPAWIRLMPRPGPWMGMVKQLAAIPIFATVIWLVWLFVQSAGANFLPALLGSFLLLAVTAWILGHWPAKRGATLSAALVLALAILLPLSLLGSAPPRRTSTSGTSHVDRNSMWQPYDEAALEKYRSEGKTVFVDFTAKWCLSCQVNERVVLDRADVRRQLLNSGVVLMRADWTRRDTHIARALHQLGRNGVPTYALYRPGERVQILPEVLTPGIVFHALDQGGNLPSSASLDPSNRE